MALSVKKTKPANPHSGSRQSQRFIDAARELGCDDDKTRFEKRLGKIAKAKPKNEQKK